MKNNSTKLLLAMGVVLSLPFFNSCQDKNKDDFDWNLTRPNTTMTVKPIDDKSAYFQIDDKTKAWPVNLGKLPYGNKEVRAVANLTEVEMPADIDKEKYAMAVKINWMDSILTKKTVVTLGDPAKDSGTYGNDPVEILKGFTAVEDGYFTLHVLAYWGNPGVTHSFDLVTGSNPKDPYEVVFRHNAHNDPAFTQGDILIAFRLSDLPDTKGETVKLKLRFRSASQGEKVVEFDYCTRKD